ncbi:hypothetical protein MKX01_023702 [Papaver californicum]|nr:hypothetical protein MKX01_023702 [Papaver californicum]
MNHDRNDANGLHGHDFLHVVALMSFSSLIIRGNNANEVVEHSLIWELKKVILNMVDEIWASSTSSGSTIPLENKPSRAAVLSPNLTSCHRSFSDANKPVYCCPPKRNSEEPIIDFKFPDPS